MQVTKKSLRNYCIFQVKYFLASWKPQRREDPDPWIKIPFKTMRIRNTGCLLANFRENPSVWNLMEAATKHWSEWTLNSDYWRCERCRIIWHPLVFSYHIIPYKLLGAISHIIKTLAFGIFGGTYSISFTTVKLAGAFFTPKHTAVPIVYPLQAVDPNFGVSLPFAWLCYHYAA
jgi:hypothetical protein